MFRKLFFVGLLIAAVVLIGAFWLNTNYYLRLPELLAQHETIVLGQNRFAPGSQAALRIIVRDSHDASPLPDAAIRISLQEQGKPPVPLYSGTTDAAGNINAAFSIPDNLAPDQKLIVETTSSLGHDRVEQAIKIERDYRILLTTDKPLYQPGQIIHLRALALSTFDRRPTANQPLDITIADSKGNKVFHKALTTSDYGVASTDFQLANEVNTGPYKITAQLGNTTSEKTVTVEHYVLPKFAIKLSTERSFYQPGQHARGTLSANYFFGKPVSNGAVTLEGYTFDVERKAAFKLQGITDANGNFDFEFDVPKYLAGSDLDNGLGHVYVQASVLDQAQHTESANLSVAVSAKPIVIRAIPESGQFRSGVENILYVLTSTPDGSPIETDLTIAVR
ncbi:MAG TPA: MG2 domain-containing protein, partial [Anaerolineae bacterium]